MSIQQDKYKALRSNNKATLINLAKKYGYKVPKNINNIQSFGKRLSNFIEKIQFEDYETGIPKVKTPKGLYKQYLNKSGLHDTTQARQNFKDIKEFTKVARQINRELQNDNLRLYLDNEEYENLKNIVGNKTTIKDFLNNISKQQLKYSPNSKTEELLHKADSSYLEEIIKRNTIKISPVLVDKLLKDFNKKSFGQRFAINTRLYTDFYTEYRVSKMQGKSFETYETLNKIIKEV